MLLTQLHPDDSLIPFVVPVCGLALVVPAVAIAWFRSIRPIDADEQPGLRATRSPGETLDYAGPPPRSARRVIDWPKFRRITAVVVGLYAVVNACWVALLVWDHRDRTTTILFIDATTGGPVAVDADNFWADCDDPWFRSSVSNTAPAAIRVGWNQPFTLCDERGGSAAHHVAPLYLNDDMPASITVRVRP